jgi:hypothetical protein
VKDDVRSRNDASLAEEATARARCADLLVHEALSGGIRQQAHLTWRPDLEYRVSLPASPAGAAEARQLRVPATSALESVIHWIATMDSAPQSSESVAMS